MAECPPQHSKMLNSSLNLTAPARLGWADGTIQGLHYLYLNQGHHVWRFMLELFIHFRVRAEES